MKGNFVANNFFCQNISMSTEKGMKRFSQSSWWWKFPIKWWNLYCILIVFVISMNLLWFKLIGNFPFFSFKILIAFNLFLSKGVSELRDLYELLMRNQGPAPEAYLRFGHQMERKGGRSPALRLRFGRRSDPTWANRPSMTEIADAA